ncbi:MAG: type II secretion system F family protein [Candidatus Omnitrophica bacterium]|nr:type II secretion system F family protein [Candidatus Omnitrophota bacterium]
MIKFAIFILSFGSVGLLINECIPLAVELYERQRQRRMEQYAPKLDRMFLNLPINKIMVLDVLIPVVLAFGAYLVFRNILAAAAAGFIGLIVPTLVIKQMERIRRQMFSQQLVDALMILSGSLKAGLSLLQAFEALVEEMPAPVSQEFGLVVRENRVGMPLEQSLNNLKKRMPIDELDLINTAILVARESGGDLTDTFSELVTTIRERNKLIGKVNALCIQGKLQGTIMGILPIAFGFFVYTMNNAFFEVMLNDQMGQMLLGGGAALYIIGIFLIMKFSKVEV